MSEKEQYIAIFENARSVICAEKACREAGIQVKVVTLPEKYSSECGMSLLFGAEQQTAICQLFRQLSMEVKIENYE